MRELADFDNAVALAFIELLPEHWKAAKLVISYKEDNNGFSISGNIESLEGYKELLSITDHLASLLMEHRSFFLITYKQAWSGYELEVVEDESGEWTTNVNFHYI